MTTITVWLLVMSGYVHGGGLGAVQPFMFPTLKDCESIAKSAVPETNSWGGFGNRIFYKCIQATVVKP